ncbi:hypothetical protein HPB47_022978 [Ixodes persulcatus]|uniref:Uncharacterized protein n=1 Tax=Ixodes persulcatus TaxID=34615 RepID=A0AC60QBK8_IXOPE|nr:hypothetical protein HPB47_022978 [Ixodes persulcatus]
MTRGADESRNGSSAATVRVVLKASDGGRGGHEMRGGSLEQRVTWNGSGGARPAKAIVRLVRDGAVYALHIEGEDILIAM